MRKRAGVALKNEAIQKWREGEASLPDQVPDPPAQNNTANVEEDGTTLVEEVITTVEGDTTLVDKDLTKASDLDLPLDPALLAESNSILETLTQPEADISVLSDTIVDMTIRPAQETPFRNQTHEFIDYWSKINVSTNMYMTENRNSSRVYEYNYFQPERTSKDKMTAFVHKCSNNGCEYNSVDKEDLFRHLPVSPSRPGVGPPSSVRERPFQCDADGCDKSFVSKKNL